MKITYVGDSGARYDWTCECRGETYAVSYHHQNDCWTVQLLRHDGERQILSIEEAERVLGEFPVQDAFDLTSWPHGAADYGICDESASPPDRKPRIRDRQRASR